MMFKISRKIIQILGAMLLLGSSAAIAVPTIVTVTSDDTAGWFERAGTGGDATGGITTNNPWPSPDGTGALEFNIAGTGGEIIGAARIPLITVDEITAIGWDFSSTLENVYPLAQVEYYSLSQGRSGTLIYVPHGSYTPGEWETVDGMTGQWWSTEEGFGAENPHSFAFWKNELAGILVNYFVVGVGSSSGTTPASTHHADLVHLATADSDTIWDFEGGAALPPELVTVTVDADNPNGWFEKAGTGGGATGGITTNNPWPLPDGTGSLQFNMTDNDGSIIQAARIPLITVDDIVDVGWDFYSDVATDYPVAKIEYYSFSQGRSGTLVYQRSGSYTANTWETVDVDPTADLWWSTEFGGGDLRTLADWQTNLTGILVNYFMVGIGSTSGVQGASTSHIDMVHLQTTRDNTVWDFEGTAVLPPPELVTVTVDSDNPSGWFTMDQAGAATGEITTTNPHGPGNTGSLEFITSGDSEDIINAARIPLVRMSDITGVGYDFYSNHGTLAPVLKVQYWDLQRFGTLQYEPINQGTYPTNTWVNVDGTSGLWWSTEFGSGDKRSFAEWQLELGDIPVTFLQVGVGSGWGSAMTGHADLVHLQTTTTNTLWDFEGGLVLPPPELVTVTVDEDNPSGWFAKDLAGAATAEISTDNAHGTADTPTGSLKFTTSGDVEDRIHVARIPLVRMNDIVAVGYDFYSDLGQAVPKLRLEYWSLQRSGSLVHSPMNYNTGEWTTMDSTDPDILWRSTEDGYETSDLRTLAAWQIELGDILVNYLKVGVGTGVSSPMTAYADLVHLQTNSSNILWDFEGVAVLPPTEYSIGGTLSGLLSGNDLVLQNNGGDNLHLNANGEFIFAGTLHEGDAYDVTVLAQPTSPNQTCTVANGSGTVGAKNVTDITVTCTTNTYTMGGKVSGLEPGNRVLLENNTGADFKLVTANGDFVFDTALEDGSGYAVTVLLQPESPNQTCAVSNGSGTLAGADVTDIVVSCVTNTYTIGGVLSGLASGSSIVLQNNSGDDLTVAADGGFTFATPLADGSAYAVTRLSSYRFSISRIK